MNRHVIRQHPTEREQREKALHPLDQLLPALERPRHDSGKPTGAFFGGGRPPSNRIQDQRVIALGGLPIGGGFPLRSRCNRPGEPLAYLRAGRKLAMRDIFPGTLMLAASLAIWAGIAWLLIERIG
jgi:hypothetical protein